MPGTTFLVRDLSSLLNAGVAFDAYLFEPETLDAVFRRRVEAQGGVIRKIEFPLTRAILGAFLGDALAHPLRMIQSLFIGFRATLRSPSEGIRALGVLPASIALARELQATGVTQTHGLWAGVPATVAFWIWRHAGIPFSFAGHAWDVTGRTALLSHKVAASRAMIVCSEFAQTTVRNLCAPALYEKIHLVHHGLDLGRWSYGLEETEEPASPGGPVKHTMRIVAVGQLIPKKGFEILVEACGQLLDQGHLIECEIIGRDGGIGAGLIDQIKHRGLENVVRLTGQLSEPEVLARMKRADVLACPSVKTGTGDSDGIPNVVLEAMAVGLPVVSTDAGGLLEVVQPEVTGLVAPQRDPGALARSLASVGRDRPAALRRAEQARRHLESDFESGVTTQNLLRAIGLAGALSESEGGTDVPASGL